MRQAIEDQLTHEDTQLIETHQLGTPLDVYKIRSGVILFLLRFSYFIFIAGIISAFIVIPMRFIGIPIKQLIGSFFFISLLFQSFICLLFGFWGLRIAVPQYRTKHLVACEQGFLQIEDIGWIKKVEVVRWKDIQSIKKFINAGIVTYQEHKTCSLDILYQNAGELFALIRQRSKII